MSLLAGDLCFFQVRHVKSQALVTNLTFLPPEMSGSGPKKDDLAGAVTFFVWCVLGVEM